LETSYDGEDLPVIVGDFPGIKGRQAEDWPYNEVVPPQMDTTLAAAEILNACLEIGDEPAWTAFVQRFQPLIAASVARVVRRYGVVSPALVDDLIQETYLRLCKDNCRSLREFKARHDEAIFGYLKVVATSVALDYIRSRSTQKRGSEVEDDGTHPEASTSSAVVEQTALIEELDQRLATTESERDRTIFWLYYRQGYTAKDIASLPGLGLTQKGVESCIYRLTQLLRNAFGTDTGVRKGRSTQTTLGVME
jgi:RNA polymerase sigma-70 factor (ECF subfamily)